MPTRILIAGDVHGDDNHWGHLTTRAKRHNCSLILQVGDFGYWEHTSKGVSYLDRLSRRLVAAGLIVAFGRGNHDNRALLNQKYATTARSPEGFWTIRPHLYYIPDAQPWTIAGVRFMFLGGAYSVDKASRLQYEHRKCLKQGTHRWCRPRTVWWPDEQITDGEAAQAAQAGHIDILLTHDKPRTTNPGVPLKNDPECWPNQDRISRVMRAVQPQLLVHGHLHYPYRDYVRVSGTDWTEVIGLDADHAAGIGRPGYNREDSWLVLELAEGTINPVILPPSLRTAAS